jgi:tryptophan synthase alpha chain
VTSLDTRLRALRDTGRKAFVPYFMAGASEEWVHHIEAAVAGGADAIEIGLPFSDPMMDGVVIQEAGLRALQRGTTLESVLQELSSIDCDVPLVAMTYYNIFLHYGLERSAGRLHDAGISGAIVPDLSLEEAGEWRSACGAHDVATVFLAAPSTPKERLIDIAANSQGFIYASARMAVTGASSDDGQAERVVQSLREVSDAPLYVGIGITTPEQAARAASFSDGAIVGAALVKTILDGASVSEVENFVGSFRDALD